jgi:hypothetical protein
MVKGTIVTKSSKDPKIYSQENYGDSSKKGEFKGIRKTLENGRHHRFFPYVGPSQIPLENVLEPPTILNYEGIVEPIKMHELVHICTLQTFWTVNESSQTLVGTEKTNHEKEKN